MFQHVFHYVELCSKCVNELDRNTVQIRKYSTKTHRKQKSVNLGARDAIKRVWISVPMPQVTYYYYLCAIQLREYCREPHKNYVFFKNLAYLISLDYNEILHKSTHLLFRDNVHTYVYVFANLMHIFYINICFQCYIIILLFSRQHKYTNRLGYTKLYNYRKIHNYKITNLK